MPHFSPALREVGNFSGTQRTKKPGPEDGPGKCWLVARIKLEALTRREPRAEILSEAKDLSPNISLSARHSRNLKLETLKLFYALLLGLTVKSRTWVKMLDICIPFSCDTNGSSSAMN